MNRKSYSQWKESGSATLIQRAREKAFEIIENHKQRNPLSNEKVKAIRQVIIDAEEEFGVAGFWKGKEEKRFIDN